MPKSRGRKSKRSPRRSRARAATVEPGKYRPGVIHVDEHAVLQGLTRLDPPQLLPIGMPTWWLALAIGGPANMCLDGALILRSAFEIFGVRAQPKIVTLEVRDQHTGHRTAFGTSEPHFMDEHFVGHMGLWLPESGRFLDHSVQQFPIVRREGWYPISARYPDGMPWGTARVAVERGRLLLSYTALPETQNATILAHPQITESAAAHRRAGINLASNYLDLLHSEHMVDRALASPHPELHALIHAVEGATTHIDEDQNYRFRLPGSTDDLLLDEIPLARPGPAKPVSARWWRRERPE